MLAKSKNPKNKLGNFGDNKKKVDENDVKGNEGSSSSKQNEKKSKKKKKDRSAMARTSENKVLPDKLMLDSGTTPI